MGEVSSLDALRREGCTSLSGDPALELEFTSCESERVCNQIASSGWGLLSRLDSWARLLFVDGILDKGVRTLFRAFRGWGGMPDLLGGIPVRCRILGSDW
jgi:hypothetical protein